MQPHKNKPHISAALAHLRSGVTATATALAVCAVLQFLIFGFVHFTTVRFSEPAHQPIPLAIAAPAHAAVASNTAAANGGATTAAAGFTPITAPRALSEWDTRFRTASDMLTSAAVIAAFLLSIFAVMGVIVAAGSGVPGVERAASAATWALLLGAACLPWHDMLPSMMFKGAFGDYATMVSLSDSVEASTASAFPMYASYLLAPVATLCGAIMVLLRFRQGVEEGVIVSSISELDQRLEREIANIKVGGAASSAPRAIAALNHAIGDKPEDPGDSDNSIRKSRSASVPRIGRALIGADDDSRRPI